MAQHSKDDIKTSACYAVTAATEDGTEKEDPMEKLKHMKIAEVVRAAGPQVLKASAPTSVARTKPWKLFRPRKHLHEVIVRNAITVRNA